VVIKPTLTGSLQKCGSRWRGACAGADGGDQLVDRVQPWLTQLARIAAWLTPQTRSRPGYAEPDARPAGAPWPDSALPCLNVDELEPLL
jgi:O-succinylbenzoate synthase